eukprot:SAG31_NODE_16805_length_695_cov_0.911074_1_plen_126_part_00
MTEVRFVNYETSTQRLQLPDFGSAIVSSTDKSTSECEGAAPAQPLEHPFRHRGEKRKLEVEAEGRETAKAEQEIEASTDGTTAAMPRIMPNNEIVEPDCVTNGAFWLSELWLAPSCPFTIVTTGA